MSKYIISRIALGLIIGIAASFWLFAPASNSAQPTPLNADNAVLKKQGLDFVPLTVREFDALVKEETRPTLLFFYASWCPHCRIQMPQIIEMEQRRAEDVRVLYVSLDENTRHFSNFIAEHHADAEFTRYIAAHGENRKFDHYLRSRNSRHNGGVPYMGLFQPDGRLTHEFLGRSPISEIEKSL